MTRYVVFIASLIAIGVLFRSGPKDAFLRVWIPFFLAMPFVFWVNIPGLPDPNFMQAAILPILAVTVWTFREKIRMGGMEWLLLGYVVLRVAADFHSRGYADAQNYLFFMLSALIGPYLLGRHLIDSRSMDIATARMFVLMFLLFFPMFLYEAKYYVSPIYKLVAPLFPDAFSGLSLRWGMARTAGTFEHPILACIMIVAVYRLHRWLDWVGAYATPQPGFWGSLLAWMDRLPLSPSRVITLVLVVMAIMTLSRGPWIGAAAGAAVALIGNLKSRVFWLKWLVAAGIAGAILGQVALDAYITPAEGEVLSGEARTMLYRKEMVEEYKAFLVERLWVGWGLTTVPKIPGMESVDNAFFLMALQHGVLAPVLFGVIFCWAIWGQLRHGLASPQGEAPIGFTFAGIYVMCAFSFLTVYMGAQTEPMLFLLLGWGESIRQRGRMHPSPNQTSTRRAVPFRRVLQ
jgi:hypothetical protein